MMELKRGDEMCLFSFTLVTARHVQPLRGCSIYMMVNMCEEILPTADTHPVIHKLRTLTQTLTSLFSDCQNKSLDVRHTQGFLHSM